MRQGWEYKKIKEICTFIGDGDWIESKDQSPSGIRLIQTGNVGNGIFKDKGDKAKYISEETFKELSCTEIYEGDCLLSRLPEPIGRGCILPKLEERTITAVDCTILRFNTNVIPQYFVYYTQSGPYSTRIDSKTTGTTRKRISRKNLENIEIPVPDQKEQHDIVSELDKINELIRLKKEQLKDYDNLAQSIFYEMFGDPVENEKGWEVKKLGDIALVKTGPFGSMLHKEDYITNGIPLINPMHMQDYKVVPNNNFTISKEKASELTNYILQKNDVIFARRGDIGRCAVVTKEEEGFLCGTGSLFVRFDSEVSPLYTMYVVRTDSFAKELISKAKGATMLNLNSTTMENLRFPLPPLPLQQTFASRIEMIEHQKAEVQKAITELETLLASRMQYWFE